MSKSPGNFLASFFEFILSLFGKKTAPAPVPTPAPLKPDSPDEPASVAVCKVALIIYDPIMENGQKLSQKMNWSSPDDLAAACAADLLQYSHGMARVDFVQRVEVDDFPVKVDGFRYTPQTYLDVLRGASQPRQPQDADYTAILARFNVLSKVASGEIDEVWLFAFPNAGLYESVMGGAGAFWCNAPPLKGAAACPRRFVVMGFNFERGVGEMLESYGHRAESIMLKTFEPLTGEANLWTRFIRYDKSAPGKAAVGNIHYAPNSDRDYDWNNPRPVLSECYDWLLNFPNFKGDVRTVTAAEWGSGKIRLHHQWWMNHIPHAAGRKNGIHNNWWQYIVNPNNVSA
ncbi:MAG: hypothetical protein M5U11_07785 [Anaerolineales bacterium]|jgi:hypothetical protein|nr:hypothetical protein [Anaerolineales bacterium]MDX9937660.1 hypothetical protein [Anaerolineales bacterium]GER81082.1 conserved hypothetical protein [Candidatus Denitrolinea symbiosum]